MFNTAYIDIITLDYSVFINHKPRCTTLRRSSWGAALVEISIAMVVLSRVLNYRASRQGNIMARVFLTGVQLVSLFMGTPTWVKVFFSVILIATSLVIVWAACN